MQIALKRNPGQTGRSSWIKPGVRVDAGMNQWENTMREINIRLFRNEKRHDWSVEINGRFHEHISTEGLTDLVEGALIIAAKSLIQSSVNGRALQDR